MKSNAELDAEIVRRDAEIGAAVLQSISKFCGRFISYPSEHAQTAHILWMAHTHRMDLWDSTPRLAALSAEPGSGKTRLLEVTELFVPRPVSAVNVSPAYLFRKVADEDGAPTILFDEIDTVFGPKAKENEEIRGLLNAGHRRGAVAGRCVVRGKSIETEEIPAYAAVALAGLGWLPDTIMSRAVIIRMRRRHQNEQVEQFRRRIHATQAAAIYERLAAWTASLPKIVEWPDLPPEVQDRDADCWEPLIALADLAGSDWPKRAREAAVTLVTANKDASPSMGVRLLADLAKVFGEEDALPTKQILEQLHAIEEAPWADLRGKPLDDRGIAKRLREYGITSHIMWFGNKQARGYARNDLQDAWGRYLPANSVTSVTTVTDRTVTPVTPVTLFPANGGEEQRCVECRRPGTRDEPLQLVSIDGEMAAVHAGVCQKDYGERKGL